jgi:hypothetical protein
MQLLSNVPSSEELFTHNVTDYIYSSTGYSEPNALSLEASIQKSVEEELYSSLEVHSPCVFLEHFICAKILHHLLPVVLFCLLKS